MANRQHQAPRQTLLKNLIVFACIMIDSKKEKDFFETRVTVQTGGALRWD
ncbi:MAG TPA: hypothetical protein VGK37_13605 [Casimicrobiaceae bacterium]